MVFEIRNYHFEPSLMREYREWAIARALPYIREHFDLVGFWVKTDETPEVAGKPLDELGSATVTWIIRWEDMASRNEVMGKVFRTPEWQAIMRDNPGVENYHRTEARFAEQL